MSAAGQTTWYGFAKAILAKAEIAAPQSLDWLAAATQGRPFMARRVIPVSTQEFGSLTRRPAYSILSNTLLDETFGVALPDWQDQLQGCFMAGSVAAKLAAN
jgi:dTDP-4-dehydrorhamnose reductase